MFSYSRGYYVSPPDDQYLKFKNRCSLLCMYKYGELTFSYSFFSVWTQKFRFFAVRQARVRISARHPMEAPFAERRRDEDSRRRASANGEGWTDVWLFFLNEF